ncbi:hypothetical protein NDU88_000917 [Pleurodeles waltl]|uniref:Uncharacterized protein n=1 Tax=Pleurodeles waltl TaxID=8319 RepID=A0AAV7TG57_PLEWA|nr:hypothetical protein NDU88_000917 [Pleurodeles waltl]
MTACELALLEAAVNRYTNCRRSQGGLQTGIACRRKAAPWMRGNQRRDLVGHWKQNQEKCPGGTGKHRLLVLHCRGPKEKTDQQH